MATAVCPIHPTQTRGYYEEAEGNQTEEVSSCTMHTLPNYARLTNEDTSASEKQTFEAAFSPLMKQALQGLSLAPDSDFEPSPSSASGPIHVPFLGAEGQPYCNGLINLMRQSDALIFAYDQLSEWEAQVSRLQNLRAAFEKDKQVAVAMLQAGKRVAEEDIAGLLADKFREVRPAQNLSADDVQTGRLLLARGADVTNTNTSPKQQPLGWGNVARDTERAIEKLCYAGQGHSRKQ